MDWISTKEKKPPRQQTVLGRWVLKYPDGEKVTAYHVVYYIEPWWLKDGSIMSTSPTDWAEITIPNLIVFFDGLTERISPELQHALEGEGS